MTTADDELLSLRGALRKLLATPEADHEPVPGRDWGSWPVLVEMGVMAFCVPEDLSGLGNEVRAALVASRELGAALHGSPYPASVAATFALSRWLDTTTQADLVRDIVAGDHVTSIAFLEPGAVVARDADGTHLDGRALLVLGAEDADSFLTLGRDADTMWFVPRDDSCTLSNAQTFDVTRSCADLVFTRTPVVSLTVPAGGGPQVEHLLRLLLAGDALGGVERMLERTTSYARERNAFGRPVGGFQAVQHRLVDHTLRVRGMSLLSEHAAVALASNGATAARDVALAEAAVSTGAVHVLHDLLQLTGAIAFTWEYGLHLYERRAHVDSRVARNPRSARLALARLEGWPAPNG